MWWSDLSGSIKIELSMALEKNKKCERQYCLGNMVLQNDVYALTVVIKNPDSSVSFNPASGMPVKAYVCSKCGVVELYSAIIAGEF